MSGRAQEPRPLDRVTSIRTKLGLLVGVSVVVSVLFVSLARLGDVPGWLSGAVAVGVALAITQLLAAGMTSPLREMTAAARRMARGDYDVEVRATAGDEVGELARAFNRMAADLATVDRQRRDLVANVAHELRTPLAGLVALMDNMVDGVIPADGPGLARALAQVERLNLLVADLLDLSKVDAGVTSLRVEEIVVAELFDDCVRVVDHDARDLDVRTSIPRDLTIRGDRARLAQLVTNLLDNAARHSPAGGTIEVSAARDGSGWRLAVADAGPGIAPADRDRIFDRFGTADPATGGTGLGLAISRWVVELHGGRIAAVAPPPGRGGALIRVELPDHPPTRTPLPTPGDPMPTTHPTSPAAQPSAMAPAPPSPPTSLWSSDAPARRSLLWGALAVGLLGGVLLPYRDLGVAWTIVLLAAGGVVVAAAWERRDRWTAACGSLALLCGFVPVLRAAEWLTVLALLVAAVLIVAGTTQGRTLLDFVWGGLGAVAAPIVGLPWLGRTLGQTLAGVRGGRASIPVLRTIAFSAVALLVFGALLASGDALLGSWVDALVPDLDAASFVLRAFVAVALGGAVLVAAFLALHPIPMLRREDARATGRRYEWLAPVLVIDALFAAFVVAQAAAVFGGDDYLRRTTGLTYAEYVHQGFGQLTVAVVLTIAVIAIAAPRARTDTAADRLWLRGAFGLLCVLTLVIVGSALHRLWLYQDAYGYTVLRVLVGVFELWLGLLVALILLAGASLRGAWVTRAGLLSGAAAFLVMAAINPEAWVAQHNLERYADGKPLDALYLSGLSPDAIPAIVGSGPADYACLLPHSAGADGSLWGNDALEWNLARARARAALGTVTRSTAGTPACAAYDFTGTRW